MENIIEKYIKYFPQDIKKTNDSNVYKILQILFSQLDYAEDIQTQYSKVLVGNFQFFQIDYLCEKSSSTDIYKNYETVDQFQEDIQINPLFPNKIVESGSYNPTDLVKKYRPPKFILKTIFDSIVSTQKKINIKTNKYSIKTINPPIQIFEQDSTIKNYQFNGNVLYIMTVTKIVQINYITKKKMYELAYDFTDYIDFCVIPNGFILKSQESFKNIEVIFDYDIQIGTTIYSTNHYNQSSNYLELYNVIDQEQEIKKIKRSSSDKYTTNQIYWLNIVYALQLNLKSYNVELYGCDHLNTSYAQNKGSGEEKQNLFIQLKENSQLFT